MKTLILFFCITLISFSGCGGSSNSGTGNTATDEDAENAATSTVETTMLVLNTILGGEDASVSAPLKALRESDVIPDTIIAPKDITVTEATSECTGTPVTSISGNTSTIQGSDLAADGSGSCSVTTQGFAVANNYEGSEAYLSCDSFSGGSTTGYATIDGTMGMEVAITEAGNGFYITAAVATTDLLMGFIEDGSTKLCDIKMLITEVVHIEIGESSATSESTTSGCLSVCGSSFNVSGTETQTVTF